MAQAEHTTDLQARSGHKEPAHDQKSEAKKNVNWFGQKVEDNAHKVSVLLTAGPLQYPELHWLDGGGCSHIALSAQWSIRDLSVPCKEALRSPTTQSCALSGQPCMAANDIKVGCSTTAHSHGEEKESMWSITQKSSRACALAGCAGMTPLID